MSVERKDRKRRHESDDGSSSAKDPQLSDTDIRITIEDDGGERHNTIIYSAHSSSTVDDLQRFLCNEISAPIKFQRIFIRESEVMDSTKLLRDYELGKTEYITMRHSLLAVWANFKRLVERVKEEGGLPKIAFMAIRCSDQLDESSFFSCYPGFIATEKQLRPIIAHYEDLNEVRIRDATRAFFIAQRENSPENPQLKVNFRPKHSKGMQGGMLCDVVSGDVKKTYFLKSHTGRGRGSYLPVDLCELLVYRLLHILNYGPEVFFVPNIHSSICGLYIATAEVVGFTRPKRSEVGTDQLTLLDILSHVFYIIDLHSDNYGLDSDGRLQIVDFQIDDLANDPEIQWRLFVAKNGGGRESASVFHSHQKNWHEAITKADDSLENTKAMIETRRINTLKAKYSTYLAKIKQNLEYFQSKFSSLS